MSTNVLNCRSKGEAEAEEDTAGLEPKDCHQTRQDIVVMCDEQNKLPQPAMSILSPGPVGRGHPGTPPEKPGPNRTAGLCWGRGRSRAVTPMSNSSC